MSESIIQAIFWMVLLLPFLVEVYTWLTPPVGKRFDRYEAELSGCSMEPMYGEGEMFYICTDVCRADLSVGDVILYWRPVGEERLILHRIVGTEGEKFITAGDYNDGVDPYFVGMDDLRGRCEEQRLPCDGVTEWEFLDGERKEDGAFEEMLMKRTCDGEVFEMSYPD